MPKVLIIILAIVGIPLILYASLNIGSLIGQKTPVGQVAHNYVADKDQAEFLRNFETYDKKIPTGFPGMLVYPNSTKEATPPKFGESTAKRMVFITTDSFDTINNFYKERLEADGYSNTTPGKIEPNSDRRNQLRNDYYKDGSSVYLIIQEWKGFNLVSVGCVFEDSEE